MLSTGGNSAIMNDSSPSLNDPNSMHSHSRRQSRGSTMLSSGILGGMGPSRTRSTLHGGNAAGGGGGGSPSEGLGGGVDLYEDDSISPFYDNTHRHSNLTFDGDLTPPRLPDISQAHTRNNSLGSTLDGAPPASPSYQSSNAYTHNSPSSPLVNQAQNQTWRQQQPLPSAEGGGVYPATSASTIRQPTSSYSKAQIASSYSSRANTLTTHSHSTNLHGSSPISPSTTRGDDPAWDTVPRPQPAGGLVLHEDAGRAPIPEQAVEEAEELPPLYRPEWQSESSDDIRTRR